MSRIKIKELGAKDLQASLPLVWDVFQKYEAVNYPEAGKQMFYQAIHDPGYLSMLRAYGAFEEKKQVGIIATREAGKHVALFFVDGEYHGQGIGRKLWNKLMTENDAREVTVHSSIYAQEVYKKLGFVQTGEIQEEDGMQYIPMIYKREYKSDCPCKKTKCASHGICMECKSRHKDSGRPRPCER